MKLKPTDLVYAKQQMRLQVFLAKSGIASRRKCEELIREGRVEVNGQLITRMGFQVTEADCVVCDGKQVKPLGERRYYALYKPAAVICSHQDEKGRRRALDFFPPSIAKGLFNVGRLDYLSEGLIFFTNDGEFARRVAHPSGGFEKEYLLESVAPLPKVMLEAYRAGVNIEGVEYKLWDFRLVNPCQVRLILKTGKNREIRRVCKAYGVRIKSLTRIRIGCVSLGRLRPGCFRRLTSQEVAWFLSEPQSCFRKQT